MCTVICSVATQLTAQFGEFWKTSSEKGIFLRQFVNTRISTLKSFQDRPLRFYTYHTWLKAYGDSEMQVLSTLLSFDPGPVLNFGACVLSCACRLFQQIR